jgi:hypothetical protein
MRAGTAILLTAVLLSGCGGAHSRGHSAAIRTRLTPADAARLHRLRGSLPAGFEAPGNGSASSGRAELKISPASGLHAAALHPAPAPAGEELSRALATVVNQPAPVIARPIFLTSEDVHPSERIGVAAAHLGPAANHAALFILQGPGYRGESLVQVADGVAAGYVAMPSQMASGRWYIAAEDISGVRTSGHRLTGIALVDVGVLQAGAVPVRPSHPSEAPPSSPHPEAPSEDVALSLRASAVVYVCLIGDNGRKLIPGEMLQPGSTTPVYHAKHFAITLGNNSVTMIVNGLPLGVPTSAQATGYSITKDTGRRPLATSQLPTCK